MVTRQGRCWRLCLVARELGFGLWCVMWPGLIMVEADIGTSRRSIWVWPRVGYTAATGPGGAVEPLLHSWNMDALSRVRNDRRERGRGGEVALRAPVVEAICGGATRCAVPLHDRAAGRAAPQWLGHVAVSKSLAAPP
jgi:hypothetical protein